jgi:hypothetical protein
MARSASARRRPRPAQYWECECEFGPDDICPKCTVAIDVDVANDNPPEGESVAITSRVSCDGLAGACGTPRTPPPAPPPQHLIIRGPVAELVEVGHFVTSAEADTCSKDPGIVLNKLGPGQALRATALARLVSTASRRATIGRRSAHCPPPRPPPVHPPVCSVQGIGKLHARFNPTATVCMRYDPVITLNTDLLQRVSPKDKREFVKHCQPGVFEFDKATQSVRPAAHAPLPRPSTAAAPYVRLATLPAGAAGGASQGDQH